MVDVVYLKISEVERGVSRMPPYYQQFKKKDTVKS